MYGILQYINKEKLMNEQTTIKVRKSTTKVLKLIADSRGRRESMEQVILELADRYLKAENGK